eukprot:scaffold12312_cov63-Phaeocystis_antarctica.AAC.3
MTPSTSRKTAASDIGDVGGGFSHAMFSANIVGEVARNRRAVTKTCNEEAARVGSRRIEDQQQQLLQYWHANLTLRSAMAVAPAGPVLGNREMQAATPAAVVRSQLLERSTGDETPAVTMLTTTPNDAIALAELVQASPSSRTVDA